MFIAIDIFREKLHNKGVDKENRLEAWLTFLSEDNPDWILRLIEAYPEFAMLYREVYEMCRNTERMIELKSQK